MKEQDRSKPEKDRYWEAEPAVLLREAWRLHASPAEWVVESSFTGKALAYLQSDDGPVCLSRLPDKASPRWIEAVQDAVAYLERNGFNLFPRFIPTESGDTAVHYGGRWYDLTAIAPGHPVSPEALTSPELEHLARAIGRLHRSGDGARGPAVRFDWLGPGQARVQRLAWDPVARGKNAWQKPENLTAFFGPLDLDAEPLTGNDTAREIVGLARETLAWLGDDPLAALAAAPQTLTHGDLWAEHVHFVEDEVGALLDLDTLALRPPGGDVAALCADFGLWDLDRGRTILAAYRQERSNTPEAVAELPNLGALRTLGVLRSRLSAWLEAAQAGTTSDILGGPVPYWLGQLRTLATIHQNWSEAVGPAV